MRTYALYETQPSFIQRYIRMLIVSSNFLTSCVDLRLYLISFYRCKWETILIQVRFISVLSFRYFPMSTLPRIEYEIFIGMTNCSCTGVSHRMPIISSIKCQVCGDRELLLVPDCEFLKTFRICIDVFNIIRN